MAAVKKTSTKSTPTHPKTLDMVMEAINSLTDSKGSSVQAIKSYIMSHYTTVSPSHITSSLRRALKAGLESGALVRPKGSTATGVTGRLRVGKLPEKKPAKKPVTEKIKKVTPKKTPNETKTTKTPKKTKPVKDTKPKKTVEKKKKPTKPSTKTKAAKNLATRKTPSKVSKPKKPKAKKVEKK